MYNMYIYIIRFLILPYFSLFPCISRSRTNNNANRSISTTNKALLNGRCDDFNATQWTESRYTELRCARLAHYSPTFRHFTRRRNDLPANASANEIARSPIRQNARRFRARAGGTGAADHTSGDPSNLFRPGEWFSVVNSGAREPRSRVPSVCIWISFTCRRGKSTRGLGIYPVSSPTCSATED